MILTHPVQIAPNLEAGVRIGDSWVTITYADRPGTEDRTRYRYSIIGELEYSDDDLQSACGGGNLYNGLCSLLSFLSSEGDSYRYHLPRSLPEADDWQMFPSAVGEWCYLNSEELETAAMALDECPACIKE